MMETIKGKPIFEHQGYLYIINKESGDKIIWCCRNYRHGQCRGRLHTINGQVIVEEQMSLGSKCPESKCRGGASVAGEQVSREQMSGERVSREQMSGVHHS